ncbi:AcrR family transcriptional regulator [Saccharothrix tamanrassetensis]|uniref:AcrR family transcriptional regulator n=1 Tax=Saccharothrix tamanrassetensis TaxID=1051531 RepID=A0A841CJS4_9PSEU|nr:TetR/AcrR family transcriptional regulator C-terminal domain-containing protein [Saccharothrix tamanrassetensis]MBB5956428.1 AcrR family transcriptional regulator [Saccharothrix tamanrassetensis]
MPRPKSLTPEDLAAAALAVIDREGLPGLSMRAVAQELGMGTMSLYRYVSERTELEALVLDLVLSTVDIRPPESSWQNQIVALVERVRDAVARHPNVIPLTMAHRHRSPALLRWSESVLEVLSANGFTGARRVVALRCLIGYLIGAMQLEHLGPLSGTGTAVMAGRTEFPLLAETATAARSLGDEFHHGLAVVVRGLEGS